MAESDPIREFLVSQGCLQSEELQTEQNAAIDKVEKLIRTWEGRLVSSKDLKSESEKYCKLVCIGSHKLGVHLKGADIDLVCIAPKWISRQEFNVNLVELLQADESVSQIRPVPHARVPVLKFTLGRVDFDLQFARLELERVEEDHDFSIKDFVSDPQCQASLVGHLDTMALKAAVPDILTFQTTLAGIKIWADRRGVHGYR